MTPETVAWCPLDSRGGSGGIPKPKTAGTRAVWDHAAQVGRGTFAQSSLLIVEILLVLVRCDCFNHDHVDEVLILMVLMVMVVVIAVMMMMMMIVMCR